MKRKGSSGLWEGQKPEATECAHCGCHKLAHVDGKGECRGVNGDYCTCKMFEPEPMCVCGHGASEHGMSNNEHVSVYDWCTKCGCLEFERAQKWYG